MSTVLTESGFAPLAVQLRPILSLSDDDFFELCQQNPDVRLELSAAGEVLIMPPAGGETGRRNLIIAGELHAWTKANGGVAFDSSTGFVLPSAAIRSPDAAWMPRERWDAIAPETRERFVPAVPDFVIELRSPTDSLPVLQAKMDEYLEAGVRLGWLVDPVDGRAYVYAAGRPVDALDRPSELAADPVLPGFVLELGSIWA
jgi:Uma2 family endonuclease